jgi:hypothetical protein
MKSIFFDHSRSCRIVMGILLLWVSLSFSEDVYHWTDEKGTVHFTDEISKVPRQYLDQVQKSEFPEGASKEEGKPAEPVKDEGSERVRKYLEAIEKRIKAKKELEEVISKLEEEMKVSQERIKEIEGYEKEYFNYYQPVKDPRTGKWVPIGSPYFDEKRRLTARIEGIEKELVLLQEKLLEISRSL